MDSFAAFERFEQLNGLRLERLIKLVDAQQQTFIALLPFVFHTNTEGLPAYIGRQTPAGIASYQPDKDTVTLARKICSSVRPHRRSLRSYPLVGLYLVNPHGLLAISRHLTFDLYLVCSNGLNQTQQQSLQQKLQAVSQWAASCDISLTTQLLVEGNVRHSLSTPSLDQFYLNALVLAGARPMWWLIAPESDPQTAVSTRAEQQKRNAPPLLDFGEIMQEPERTIIIQQLTELLANNLAYGLQKAFQLAYLYCKLNWPNETAWPSMLFKQHVYDGMSEPLNVDCNTLYLEQISTTPINDQWLLLARQSFYLQTNEDLSRSSNQPRFPWRHKFVKQLCEQWQWQHFDLALLGKRVTAHYAQCLAEHKATLAFFTEINRSLLTFSKQYHYPLPANHKLTTLSLEQFNDHQTNRINTLPKGLWTKTAEEKLHFYRFGLTKDWKVSLISLSEDSQMALYQHASLLNVITWAIANRLLTKSTRLMVADQPQTVTIKHLAYIVEQLLKSHVSTSLAINKVQLMAPEKFEQVILFANIDHVAVSTMAQPGLELSSLHNDPLNYAKRGISLVNSIDGLIYSSRGYWYHFRYTGKTAVLDGLMHLMPWWQTNPVTELKQSYFCPSERYGTLISERIQEVYQQVQQHFTAYESADFLIAIADNYYRLTWQPGHYDLTTIQNADTTSNLLTLAKPQAMVRSLDPMLDPTGLYSAILKHQQPSQVSIFISNNGPSQSIHILDDYGCIFSQPDSYLNENTLLTQLDRFFTALKKSYTTIAIAYLRLTATATNNWQATPLTAPQLPDDHHYLPVRITMDKPEPNVYCTITCGPKQFSGRITNNALFSEVATFLQNLRQSTKPYPLYITEITFNDAPHATVRDYIEQKQRLESLLNAH